MIERILPPRKPSIVDRITIHYDGVKPPLQTIPAAWSFLAKLNAEPVHHDVNAIDPSLNPNEVTAPFLGLYMGLQWLVAQDRFYDHVTFLGDNMLIAGSMAGTRLPPDSDQLRPIWSECRKLASLFHFIQFVWITKKENRECRQITIDYLQKPAHVQEPA